MVLWSLFQFRLAGQSFAVVPVQLFSNHGQLMPHRSKLFFHFLPIASRLHLFHEERVKTLHQFTQDCPNMRECTRHLDKGIPLRALFVRQELQAVSDIAHRFPAVRAGRVDHAERSLNGTRQMGNGLGRVVFRLCRVLDPQGRLILSYESNPPWEDVLKDLKYLVRVVQL